MSREIQQWTFLTQARMAPFLRDAFFDGQRTGLRASYGFAPIHMLYLNGENYAATDQFSALQKKLGEALGAGDKCALVDHVSDDARLRTERLLRTAEVIAESCREQHLDPIVAVGLLDLVWRTTAAVGPGLLIMLAVEQLVAARMRSVLEEHSPNMWRDHWHALLFGGTTAYIKENNSTYRIARLVLDLKSKGRKVNSRESKQAIKAFVEKYAWLPLLYGYGQPWSTADVTAIASNTPVEVARRRLQKMASQNSEGAARFRRSMADPDVPADAKVFGRWLASLSEVRARRRDAVAFAVWKGWPAILSLADALCVKSDQVLMFTLEELMGAAIGRKPKGRCAELRAQGFCMLVDDLGTRFVADEEVERIASRVDRFSDAPKVLQGTPASPGKAVGKALLVAKGTPLHPPSGSTILVSRLAEPGLLDVMSSCVGAVFGGGGVTSHMARLARELGIPCVVDVGPALDSIKTGQVLEVEGGEGQVRLSE